MKQPILKFEVVYIVESWQTEIITGVGTFFKALKEGICIYENRWLVYPEGKKEPVIISDRNVFTDPLKAKQKLQEEKTAYINFLEKDIKSQQERLKSIKP